jgi:hypothetical protein
MPRGAGTLCHAHLTRASQAWDDRSSEAEPSGR